MEKKNYGKRKRKLTSSHSTFHVIHQVPRLLQIFIVIKPVLPPDDLGRIAVRARARAAGRINAKFSL